MKTSRTVGGPLFRKSAGRPWAVRLLSLLVFALLSAPGLRAESGVFKSKANRSAAELPVSFPTPVGGAGLPQLLVIPLLGPLSELWPGGKLVVWVGYSDGTPLANTSVTIRVPQTGNSLVDGVVRRTDITVQTQADGMAEVTLAAPEIPVSPGDDGPPAA